MDTAELNHLQEQITQLVRNRFPGPTVQEVRVLQYGDEPEIEPGQLLVQVVIEPPGGQRPDGTEADALIVSEFDHSQKEAIQGLRHDLRSVPQVAMVEFVLPGDGYPAGILGHGQESARPRWAPCSSRTPLWCPSWPGSDPRTGDRGHADHRRRRGQSR